MAKKKMAARRPATSPATDAEVDEADADVEFAAQQVESAREQLQAAEALLAQARENAVEHVAWLRDRTAGELIDTTLEFVRKHPGLGVLSAASVGYFLGRLFRR